jgi:hypothetical protein
VDSRYESAVFSVQSLYDARGADSELGDLVSSWKEYVGGCVPQGHDGPDGSLIKFFEKPGFTGTDFDRCRSPVISRSASTRVVDVDVASVDAVMSKDLIQQLSAWSGERDSVFGFLVSGRFTHDSDSCTLRPDARRILTFIQTTPFTFS